MPDSPDRDLDKIQESAVRVIEEHKGRLYKVIREPIAFGLTAIKISYILDEEEAKGGTDPIDADLKNIEGVNDAETTDVTKLMDVSFG